jgi:hypothetical protein
MGLVGEILLAGLLENHLLEQRNSLSVCGELEVFNLVVASVNQS